jgi:hypothetical protein
MIFIFIFSEQNGRRERPNVAILLEHDYSSTYLLGAAHKGPKL